MKISRTFIRLAATSIALFLLGGAALHVVRAQQDREDDEIKGLIRVKRAATQGRTPGLEKNRSSYRKPGGQSRLQAETKLKPIDTIKPETDAPIVGVTLWQLRPSAKDEAVEIKDLLHPAGGGAAQEFTPVRVAADEALHDGQMVRLSIESFRSGYLYVIDRPKYADGSYGDPYLIFPTKRIYGGDNKVEAGKVVRIPGPEDDPGYFELTRSQSRQGELQVAEELIIIIKPEPFESLITPPADRKPLTAESVEALVKKYAAPVEHAEMNGGAGQAITVAEVKAALRRTNRLSEDDALPQSVYRLNVKPTDPMLVRFGLLVSGKPGQ